MRKELCRVRLILKSNIKMHFVRLSSSHDSIYFRGFVVTVMDLLLSYSKGYVGVLNSCNVL
jgi:hypothetical protein